jgi:DNA repair protein RadC
MTIAQKKNIARFKAVQADAKKLKAKNKNLTHIEAVKKAWAMQKKVGAIAKKNVIKKKIAPKKKVGDYKNKDIIYKDIRGRKTNLKGSYNLTRSDDGTFAKFSKISGKIPSNFVSLSGYNYGKEIVIGSVTKLNTLKNLVPDVKLRITRGKKTISDTFISAEIGSEIFKRFIGKNKIETQELFAVAYLNQANKVLGVYVHSVGAINAVNIDVRLILAGALQLGATGLVMCHNHPSGNLKPSSADEKITTQLAKAASFHNIQVLDHIIITKEGYFSFAQDGLI